MLDFIFQKKSEFSKMYWTTAFYFAIKNLYNFEHRMIWIVTCAKWH